MKQIIRLTFSFLVIGCAANTKSPDNPAAQSESSRNPASVLPSQIPIASSVGSSSYQGPIMVDVDGIQRTSAKLFLPTNYDTKEKWPLVISLHGFGGWADFVDNYFTLRYRTTSKGFILLAPEGTATPQGTMTPDGEDLGGKQFWNATDFCCDFKKTKVDDVEYLRRLLQSVKAKYKVDPKMVYVIGHSNGGFMANRLACEIGTEIAAFASLGGGSFKDVSLCRVPTPSSFLQIHAQDDKTVFFNNVAEYAGGQETVQQWVGRNSCAAPGKKGRKFDFLFLLSGNDTVQRTWTCPGGKGVALWTIKPAKAEGHNPHIPLFNLNFTDEVLDFFFRHKL